MEKKYYVETPSKGYSQKTPYGMCYTDIVGSSKEFKSRDEAVTYAKKEVARTREDVPIYTIDSVAKFPIDDIKVEAVV